MLIKYLQKYNLSVFYFLPLEVATAALKRFCVMIPSLVDTSLDFGLFRVVRPNKVGPRAERVKTLAILILTSVISGKSGQYLSI